jgi:hypothetical protein
MTYNSRPNWPARLLPVSLLLSACSSLMSPASESESFLQSKWLDRLGTELRAETQQLLHRWEASEPTPSQPLKCGLGAKLVIKPEPICAADPKHLPGCVAGIGPALHCTNF